jgi:hypothetical protein
MEPVTLKPPRTHLLELAAVLASEGVEQGLDKTVRGWLRA